MWSWSMLIGSASELFAGILLWLSEGGRDGSASGTWAIFPAIVLHALSSYFFAHGFWEMLPRRYKLPEKRSLGFLFSVILILPVLGVLGILWSISIALKHPRSRSARNVRIIVLPELPFSPPVIFPTLPYSEGALRQIVHFAERPLKRLKAVMATRYMLPRDAMEIWSTATRDPVDDVRLLAYSMQDDSEKSLADRIVVLTEALGDIPVNMRHPYHRTIAALCWELVYHRLVQGALREHWLKTARHHMELVLHIPPTNASSSDADSWLLYGRILLESKELSAAEAAFINAREGGIDEQKILPWFAEIAFERRRYAEVTNYMTALSRSGEKGKQFALVKAWWSR